MQSSTSFSFAALMHVWKNEANPFAVFVIHSLKSSIKLEYSFFFSNLKLVLNTDKKQTYFQESKLLTMMMMVV